MPPHRYAAPLSLVELDSGNQQRCPYCRSGSYSLYRLHSWPEGHAGCAYCVLDLLSSKEYLIYHSPGSTDYATATSPSVGRPATQSEANTQSRADG